MLPEVSHSIITRFVAEQENRAVDIRYLKPYFKTGSLVDALLTEPEKWNDQTGILLNHTRYGKEELIYTKEEIVKAKDLYEAFKLDSIGGMFYRLGNKIPFHHKDEFVFSYKGTSYAANLSGESDLSIPSEHIGSDIKVTACLTQKEFSKKVQELYYDQQGALYSDALHLDNFVIIGLSREAIDKRTGLPQVFHYPMERGCKRMKQGQNRYASGIVQYYSHKNCINESKELALRFMKSAA